MLLGGSVRYRRGLGVVRRLGSEMAAVSVLDGLLEVRDVGRKLAVLSAKFWS